MNRCLARSAGCARCGYVPRRGFVLIYVLVFISLFMVAAVMFTHLMRSTMKASNGAQSQSASVYEIDHLMNAMRQDVWNATRIRVNDPHSLQLTHDGHVVQWKFSSTSAVRTQQAPPQPDRQYTLGGITVAGNGAAITVTIPTPSHSGGGQFPLASQLLLAQGGTP